MSDHFITPAVDIFDNGKNLVIIADMPGVAADYVDITVENDVLTILGTIKTDSINGNVLLKEYDPAHYLRRFTLDCSIDQQKINGTLKGGVLKLNLPKRKTSSRKIFTERVL